MARINVKYPLKNADGTPQKDTDGSPLMATGIEAIHAALMDSLFDNDFKPIEGDVRSRLGLSAKIPVFARLVNANKARAKFNEELPSKIEEWQSTPSTERTKNPPQAKQLLLIPELPVSAATTSVRKVAQSVNADRAAAMMKIMRERAAEAAAAAK